MSDRGHAGVELALAIGVLMLPVALVVTAFAPWSETRVAAEALAAEAARAAVLDLDLRSGESTLEDSAAAFALELEAVRTGWCGAAASRPAAGACSLSRGAVVTVTVEVWTPLIQTPWGNIGGLWVSANHAEPIDLYRSLG